MSRQPLIVLTSLGVRYYRTGEWWVFHIIYFPAGAYISPHFSTGYAVLSVVTPCREPNARNVSFALVGKFLLRGSSLVRLSPSSSLSARRPLNPSGCSPPALHLHKPHGAKGFRERQFHDFQAPHLPWGRLRRVGRRASCSPRALSRTGTLTFPRQLVMGYGRRTSSCPPTKPFGLLCLAPETRRAQYPLRRTGPGPHCRPLRSRDANRKGPYPSRCILIQIFSHSKWHSLTGRSQATSFE